MAGVGSIIPALDYNSIQSVISNVLGIGSGNSGYGQAVSSTQVSANALITVAQMVSLRNDLSKARVHQTNTAVADGLASTAGNIGSPYQTLQLITIPSVAPVTIQEAIRQQYSQFATGVQTNGDVIAASGQSTPSVSVASITRVADWNGTISSTVTVTFGGFNNGQYPVSAADHARVFFNAGGTITYNASNASWPADTSASKSSDWASMLSGVGTVSFGAAATGISGTVNSPGTYASSSGFRSLTIGGSAVRILTQASSVSVYNENRFYIDVSRPTADTLSFVFTFADLDTGGVQLTPAPGSTPGEPSGPVVDEPVKGTLTSNVTCTYPSGSNVSVAAPSGSATAIV
jgi:hypothetical protein